MESVGSIRLMVTQCQLTLSFLRYAFLIIVKLLPLCLYPFRIDIIRSFLSLIMPNATVQVYRAVSLIDSV